MNDRQLGIPDPLVICARRWLVGEADDLDERRPCLEAVLELNEPLDRNRKMVYDACGIAQLRLTDASSRYAR